jgi:hypothetical protein
LFSKEFSVSTAPEVGRIIGFQNLPSTTDLLFLSKMYLKREIAASFYIEESSGNHPYEKAPPDIYPSRAFCS